MIKSYKEPEADALELSGTAQGFCYNLPKAPNSPEGFAHIPPPVLDDMLIRSYKEPEADALARFSKCLFNFRTRPIRGAKLAGKQTNTAQI